MTSRSPRKLSRWQKILLVAVFGIAVLCYLAVRPVQETGEIAYRMTWLVLTGVALSIVYYVNHDKNELDVRRSILLMTLIIAQIALNHLLEIVPREYEYFTYGQLLLVLPYALAPGIAAVLLGRKLAVFVALCTSLFGMAIMPQDCPAVIMADYMAISLLAGFLSAILCDRMRRRERFFSASIATGCAVFVSAIALGCFRNNGLASIREGFDVVWFVKELLMALGASFVVAVVAGGLIAHLERLFNITTHMTWLEWTDMSHPLLDEMSRKAPGTFQHCLSVKNLAEAAAEAIGIDKTRVGACALFHDIGKLKNPDYFGENDARISKELHAKITPKQSAQIIIQHVQDGIKLARENNLNIRIVNVIREHHGINKADYFYGEAQREYEEEKKKFDAGLTDTCPEPVDASLYTYKGPIPQTRESGLVSMADVVESSTRSILPATADAIMEKIDTVIRKQILSGHLKDSQLTLGEIDTIKKSFFDTLRTMHHTRIAYPKTKEDDEMEKEAAAALSSVAEEKAVESSAKVAS